MKPRQVLILFRRGWSHSGGRQNPFSNRLVALVTSAPQRPLAKILHPNNPALPNPQFARLFSRSGQLLTSGEIKPLFEAGSMTR
jgi:hypothetical protein